VVQSIGGERQPCACTRVHPYFQEDTLMRWAAVFLVAYVAGFVEFWRLCRTAPLMREDQPDTVGEEEFRQRKHVSVQPEIPIQRTTTSRLPVDPTRAKKRLSEPA
jgi:hypothetical protein